MKANVNRPSRWGLTAALAAAVAASACCTIPLLLVTLGASGAWVGSLTAFEPYRPFFIAAAAAALGYAAYREWRLSRLEDCGCEMSLRPAVRRTILAVSAVVVVGLIASPWIIQTGTAGPGGVEAAPTTVEEVVLEVEGMTCETCNITVQRSLTNLDGVLEAQVTFEPPQAVVHYDPARTSPAAMTEATANVGYPSTVVTES